MQKINEIEIPLKFKNFKLHKDKEINLSGSYLYFIQGPNKVGKSSVLQALAILMSGKNNIDEIITKKEKEGYLEGIIPGINGKYTVRYTFETDKFIAIDEKGRKINNITEFRNLFKYTHLTATELLKMSENSKGKEQQREIILNLLPEKDKKEFINQKDIEKVKYDDRANKNRELDTLKKALQSFFITKEENTLLEKENASKELLIGLKRELESIKRSEEIKSSKNRVKGYFISIKDEIKKYTDNPIEIQDAIEQINETIFLIYPLENTQSQIEIEQRIKKGESLIEEINKIKNKKELYDKQSKNLNTIQQQWEILDKEVKEARNKQKEIINNSNLPIKNIDIDDNGLRVDGLSFTENQICTSDAIKIIANIMVKINQSPIMLMGDAGDLDWKSLQELNKIAEQNNKIMIFDEVDRTKNEMVVVGYSDLKNNENDKKETKTTETLF